MTEIKNRNTKWTEIHEMKILLLYKRQQEGGNKTNLIQALSKDEDFVQAGIFEDSIRMKLSNIESLISNKGLENASELNKAVFEKYKNSSSEDLEKAIKEAKEDKASETESAVKAESTKDTKTESAKGAKTEASSNSQKEPEDQEKTPEATPSKKEVKSKEPVKLQGLFAFKMSMTRFYDEKGGSLPVTALKYEPSYVSQIKTKEKDSYSAVQVAFKAQKNKRCSKAVIQHLKPAGFKEGARFIKEIKQDSTENIQLGDELSIQSLEKGDLVRISALSKGKGFTGVMKRWNFRGGRASHGSKAHRRTGSIGQHTKPGRVFPGRKMPGQHGFKQVSRLKAPVVEVLPEEGIIFVKGPVPGARNTLVSLQKMPEMKG